MNHEIINYHTMRRPFIIVPQIGIIFGELGNPVSHSEILANLGLNQQQVKDIINNFPRGYFLNNKLVIYQLDDVKEGDCWALDTANYPIVKKYFNDLKKIYEINEKTQIFLGVKRGKLGDIWDTVNPVSLDFFD